MKESPRYRLSEREVSATTAEIAGEKAASLGRAGRRLEEALSKLSGSPAAGTDQDRRAEQLDEAAEALYFYVVQREACGLRDTDRILRELDILREVQLRMGTRRRGMKSGVG